MVAPKNAQNRTRTSFATPETIWALQELKSAALGYTSGAHKCFVLKIVAHALQGHPKLTLERAGRRGCPL